MKIYRLSVDVNTYQTILTDDESVWDTDLLNFDCQKKANIWQAPELFIFNPKKKSGDFSYITPGSLIINQNTVELLAFAFEMAGELLEINVENDELYMLNVLECVNALDTKKTTWNYCEDTGAKLNINQYSFHPNRISESSIFKIPETSNSEILCYSGVKDPDDEFYSLYKKHNLTGLVFTELWSSDT